MFHGLSMYVQFHKKRVWTGSIHALYRRIKYMPSNTHSNVNHYQFCTYRNQQNFKTPTVLLIVTCSLGQGRNGQEALQFQPSNVSDQWIPGLPGKLEGSTHTSNNAPSWKLPELCKGLFFKVQAFKNEGERKEGITAIQIWKEVNGGKQWWGKPSVNHSYTLGFLKRSGGNAGYLWKWGWSGRLKFKKLVESLRSNWIPRWMFGGFFSGLEDKAQLQVGLSYQNGIKTKNAHWMLRTLGSFPA